MKVCVKCGGDPQPLSAFPVDRKRPDGRHPWCLECRRAAAHSYRQAAPEKVRGLQRGRSRRHRLAHVEEITEQRRTYQQENPEQVREWGRRWDEANPEARREGAQRRNLEYRAAVFAHYGEACACCGTTEQLSIDHVNGGGSAHRIELFGRSAVSTRFYRWLIDNGFPDGFQTLCLPCNASKSTGDACRLNHSAEANGHTPEADPEGAI